MNGDEDTRGDDVYQPDGSEVQDDEGLLDASDTLDTRGVPDPLDEGWSPPERPLAVNKPGTTASEAVRGESLDRRLVEEVPDPAANPDDGIGDTWDTDGEVRDGEGGRRRSGRLVAPDEGAHADEEKDMVARDVGIDGAAASAEEAAMHVVDDDQEEGLD